MPGKQFDTPKKARILGAYDYLRAKGIPFQKTELFSFFRVSRPSGYRILGGSTARTRHNDPDQEETRGRPRTYTEGDLNQIEDLLETEGFEARELPWAVIPAEAGVDKEASERTIQTSAATRDLYKRLAKQVRYKSETERQARLFYAQEALRLRPAAKDWHTIFFSDESHFGYDDEDQARIVRKPGTRLEPENLQERRKPQKKDRKRLHCWAAVGYDFKSDLIWYEVPTNGNGKLTQEVYRKEILEKVVKQWIDEGRTFVLEEDNDSGHGPSAHNPVRAWKEKHGLNYFFNCPQSPDLSPIENAWSVPKQYIRKYAHWDIDTVKELAEEGWKELSQETINRWIESMPERLNNVINLDGKMTGW